MREPTADLPARPPNPANVATAFVFTARAIRSTHAGAFTYHEGCCSTAMISLRANGADRRRSDTERRVD